jgi:hypothetical protein
MLLDFLIQRLNKLRAISWSFRQITDLFDSCVHIVGIDANIAVDFRELGCRAGGFLVGGLIAF